MRQAPLQGGFHVVRAFDMAQRPAAELGDRPADLQQCVGKPEQFGVTTVPGDQPQLRIGGGPLPIENLSFFFQINNLENEPFISRQAGFDARPSSFQEFGRTTLFGISYKW